MKIHTRQKPNLIRKYHSHFLQVKNVSILIKLAAISVFISIIATYTPPPNGAQRKSLYLIGKGLGGGAGEFITGSVMYNTPIINSLKNWLGSLFIERQKIILDIPHKNMQNLIFLREKAINHGVNIDKDNWFKASLRTSYSSESLPIKLRLKGDWVDHLKDGRWSFRVKLRGNNYFQGMKIFSIQPAGTKSYIFESTFHKFLKFEELPHLRYKFIELSINGSNKGVYAIEEYLGIEAIENSGFRESIILRFSESNLFTERLRSNQLSTNGISSLSRNNFNSSDSASLKPANNKKIANDNNFRRLFSRAFDSYELFARGDKDPIDTFDYSAFAKFYAISDLFETGHARIWHNLRFYFNPLTGKFMPIGFDASAADVSGESHPSHTNDLSMNKMNTLDLFEDLVFAEEYVHAINRITSEENLDKFFAGYRDHLNSDLQKLHNSFPFVGSIEERIRFSAKRLAESLDPPPDPFQLKSSIHSQINKSNKKISLFFSSNHTLPIDIISVETNSTLWIPSSPSSHIPRRNADKGRIYNEIIFKRVVNSNNTDSGYKIDNAPNDYVIKYKTIGSSNIKSKNIKVVPENLNKFSEYQMSEKVITTHNPSPSYFNINNNNTLSFVRKNILITNTIKIPAGYKLKVVPGSNIKFSPGASLISYSPLIAQGTKSSPISFIGSSTSSLLILNTPTSSTIENVFFENFGIMKNEDPEVSGAITFYESPVNIVNSVFSSNLSEDALNIFRSKFTIDNTRFENCKSDAIDIDFSSGRISNSKFVNIGNDAMDFSGSNVRINASHVQNIGDKALSAGENSTINAKNIKIMDASVGIASKDSSRVFVNDSMFKNVDVCIASFNKKPFFKGGNVSIKSINGSCKVPYLIEKNSHLILNGNLVKFNSNDVKNLMYGRRFGKATYR